MRKPSRARRLSLTSLIDVIFLLLLFFMLSSTFTRFAEVDLSAAGAGSGAIASDRPIFLRLSPDAVLVNGEAAEMPALPDRLARIAEGSAPVVVAMADSVTAQRLTDLLSVLRTVPGLRVTVLEGA